MGQTTNLNWWTRDFWTINSIFRPTSLIFWMSFMPCNSSPESFTMRSPTLMDSVGCSAFHWESTPFESQSVGQVMISSGWFAQGCSVVGKKVKKILSQIVVQNGDESRGMESVKHHPKNQIQVVSKIPNGFLNHQTGWYHECMNSIHPSANPSNLKQIRQSLLVVERYSACRLSGFKLWGFAKGSEWFLDPIFTTWKVHV